MCCMMTYKEKHNLNIKIFHCKLSYQNYCIIYSCTITLTAVHLLPQKEEQGNINFPSIQKTQSTCGCWDKLSSKQNYCWRSTVCLQFAIFSVALSWLIDLVPIATILVWNSRCMEEFLNLRGGPMSGYKVTLRPLTHVQS